MACWAEHLFVLDFAVRHASWQPAPEYFGWRAGTNDPHNHLAIYPDEICDWLWQKEPRVRAVLDYGLGRARADYQAGALLGASLKLALLSHSTADAVAVSHTWLDHIGDETDFESPEVLHLAFHDPVEYPVGEYIDGAQPTAGPPAPSFAAAFEEAQSEAYHLGRRVYNAFFAGEDVRPPMLRGVENSARLALRLFEAAATPAEPLLTDPAAVADVSRRWVLRHVFEMPGTRIVAEAFRTEFIERLWAELGYRGAGVFDPPSRCRPEVYADRLLWEEERRQWRAGPMAGILPPKAPAPIGADWRPSSGLQIAD